MYTLDATLLRISSEAWNAILNPVTQKYNGNVSQIWIRSCERVE